MTMQYGNIKGIDKQVSRIVQGTMMLSTDRMEEGIALLDMVFAHGVTTFDCAHVYGGGQSERVMGEWMQKHGNREQVVILSKGCHHNQDRKRVTPYDLTADLMDSLARLKSDYIDLYVLHRDNPDMPVGPIVETLNEHYAAGRIRGFGGSNWHHTRLAEANAYADKHGLVPMTVSSPNFGLAEQVLNPWGPGCVTLAGPQEEEARQWYLKHDMPVFAYSSLARGFFSGRFRSDEQQKAEEILEAVAIHAYGHPVNYERLARVEVLAQEKGATVPQIAIAYSLHSALDVYPLVASYNEKEMEDNLKAFDISLTAEECAWLDLRSETRQ